MTNLVIFTASSTNKQAYEHFENTIARSCKFSESNNLTSKEKSDLLKLYPSGEARFWGSRPGLKHYWEKLLPGDIVLIYQDKYYIFKCRIKYIFHNEKFAEEIWGRDLKTNEKWEYIYFLDDFEEINIDMKEINEPLNYHPGFGFKVFSEDFWAKRLGQDFFLDKIKELENEANIKIEEEAEDIVERLKKSKEELLKEAAVYKETKPGYTTKLRERKERNDDEVQKAKIKKIEDYSCQICGTKIRYKSKKGKILYSISAAHIKPKNRGGDESLSNIIILCYNCHKKLDLGIIKVDIKNKKIQEEEKEINLQHDNHLFV